MHEIPNACDCFSEALCGMSRFKGKLFTHAYINLVKIYKICRLTSTKIQHFKISYSGAKLLSLI